MQVHRQHAVDTDRIEHVGNDLGRNRHPRRARAAVLTRITHVGNSGGYPAGRGTLKSVDQHQHFHQIVVGRCADRLQHENILAAHVLQHFNHDFAVTKATDLGFAEMDIQMFDHIRSKFRRCTTSEHH